MIARSRGVKGPRFVALSMLAAAFAGCAISFDGYELDRDGSVTDDASTGSSGSTGVAGAISGVGGNAVGGAGGGTGGVVNTGGAAGGTGGNVTAGGAAGIGGNAGSIRPDAAGGSGGSTPDAGKAGAGGSGGMDAGPAGCPTTGTPMIEITIPMGASGYPGTYCVDRTEVTNKQYADFLAKNPLTTGQPPGCSWNMTYVPQQVAGTDNCPNISIVYDPLIYPTEPVACVDWCDAFAYCKSVGKRLCGSFGGGGVAQGQGANVLVDQWHYACSKGGTRTYPYGSTYQGLYCNTLEYNQPGSIPVAQAVNCIGGFDPIYDMSGNVAEWEDACAGTTGANDTCMIRGGFYNSFNATAACASTPTTNRARISRQIGFRCCYDGK